MSQAADTNPARRQPRSRWKDGLEVAGGLFWNPIVEKEILARMRSWRAPAAISLFIFILSFVGWVALAITSAASNFSGGNGGATPGIGLGLFAGLMVTEMVLVILMAPALTAGAISGEKERQTMDLLLCTRVRPSAIVAGKLVSSVLFILLLVLISVPLLSFVFLFGGVEVDQVVVTTLLVAVTAVSIGAIGIFCSALVRNTIGSTALAFVLTLLFLVGPAILPYMVTALTNPQNFMVNRGQPVYQLGEPFIAMAATLTPPSISNSLGGARVVGGASGTICTSTPTGTQCRSTGGTTLGSFTSAQAVDNALPFGNVMLQGDTVVAGPLVGWKAWQLFTLLDLVFAALLVFLSTVLVGGNRTARAGRALRPPRNAELPPVGGPGAPLPPPSMGATGSA